MHFAILTIVIALLIIFFTTIAKDIDDTTAIHIIMLLVAIFIIVAKDIDDTTAILFFITMLLVVIIIVAKDIDDTTAIYFFMIMLLVAIFIIVAKDIDDAMAILFFITMLLVVIFIVPIGTVVLPIGYCIIAENTLVAYLPLIILFICHLYRLPSFMLYIMLNEIRMLQAS